MALSGLSREYFEGFGWFYFVGTRWTPRTHCARISVTATGSYAVYLPNGDLLGFAPSHYHARKMFVERSA